jgi:hypothetical protein
VKIYAAAVEAPRKSKDTMKLSLPPKLVEKLVWSQLFPFVKFSFTVRCLMPYIMPKLAVLIPSAPDFTDNSNVMNVV